MFADAASLTTTSEYELTIANLYVSTIGDDSHDCLSPATACATINRAIERANPDDTILVGAGDFTGNRQSTKPVIDINRDVILSGGWNTEFTSQDGYSNITPAGEANQLGLNAIQGVDATLSRFHITGVANIGTLIISDGTFNGANVNNDGHLTLQNVDVSCPSNYGAVCFSNNSMLSMSDGNVSSGLENNGEMIFNHVTLQQGWVRNYGTAEFNYVTMSGVSGSWDIGPLNNAGTLTLNHCDFTHNTANTVGGAIYNSGTLEINYSIINDNATDPNDSPNGKGGAVYISSGSVTVDHSTIANNQTDQGGGFYLYSGTLTVVRSAIVGNKAENQSQWPSQGGGIFVENGTVNIDNSTLSFNTVKNNGGAIYLQNGSLSLNNSTLANNVATSGGGLYNQNGSVTSQNSLYTLNKPNDCTGNLVSMGYNLFEKPAECLFSPGPGDLQNVSPNVFVLIGSPPYHPLIRFSLAIDAGNPTGCTDHQGDPLPTDQRDANRIGRCDIGSYEYDPANDPLSYMFMPSLKQDRCSTPVYYDNFSNPNSGWPVHSDDELTLEYRNGEYRMYLKSKEYYVMVRPGYQAANYALTANVRNVNGTMGSYGLAFGIASDWSLLYTFEIFLDGYFGIYRYDPSDIVTLFEGTSSAIIQGSGSNLLRVERNGSSIKAYANGTLLVSLNDGTYTGTRYVGLVAWTYDAKNLDARFDNFAVYAEGCWLGGATTATTLPLVSPGRLGVGGFQAGDLEHRDRLER